MCGVSFEAWGTDIHATSKQPFGAALRGGETYQPVCSQGDETGHEMAGDLHVPPHAPFGAGAGLLDTGTDPEAHAPGTDMARQMARANSSVPGRVDIDGVRLSGGSRMSAPPPTAVPDLTDEALRPDRILCFSR